MDTSDLGSATMLVTGGNTGIGFETVIGLARTGARVVFTSRDEGRGRAALADARRSSGNDAIDVMALDLASLRSIHGFAEDFGERYERLDVLVANAGVASGHVRRETADGFELMLGVNHLGHMALIDRLEPRLRASAPSRVVVVSSGAYVVAEGGICFDDLQHTGEFHGMRVYGESKLANIWYALELARRLDGTGVTVNVLNPGLVATELGRPRDGEEPPPAPPEAPRSDSEQALIDNLPEPVPPEIGARTSIKLATSPDLDGVSGTWWSAGRPGELNDTARDRAQAERLWEVSEQLLHDAALDVHR
ncbi:MAG: SDR family oxidoreductase [Actinomycetota bacterium]